MSLYAWCWSCWLYDEGIDLNMSKLYYTPIMVYVVLCRLYICFLVDLRLCIAPSITRWLLGKLMNKKENSSLLMEQELTVMWLKNVINPIYEPMECLAFEYIYMKYVTDINVVV